MTDTPRLINTYDQQMAAGGDRIVFYYYGRANHRSMQIPHWAVARYVDGKEKITDPKAAWYEHGHKTFTIGNIRKDKLNVLAEAVEWVSEKYGCREFVRNRMGDYVEKEVNDKFPIPKHPK